MKINLLLNCNDTRAGFINVDPYTLPGDTDKVQGNIYSLDEFADDAEVTDLLALDVIDYAASVDTNEIITHWLRKLRHGGTITLGGVDVREVAHAFLGNRLTLTEANILLYGAQRAPWEYRKASLTIQHVIQTFKDQGLKLEHKRIKGYFYYVTASRP